MFDFFGEVVEFGNQIVYYINWIVTGVNNFRGYIQYLIENASTLTQGLPTLPAMMITAILTADVFEFIRGR